MTGIIKACALAIFAGAMANAATTTSTTLTVTSAAVSLTSGTSASVSGPATLTNFGSGTFSATATLGSTLSGNFTITLSGGTLTGTITFSTAILQGSGTGSATVTGGTGGYAGATGSFQTLNGTGGISGTGITLTFSGAGAITVGGATGTTGTTGTTGSTGSTGSTGATGATGSGPSITAVQDAGSYTSGIAEGSIFVVKGTNLSPSGLGSGGLLSFGFPLPSSSNGVSINFAPTSGGSAASAYLIYLYNSGGTSQLAAILPSNIPPGNYNVTVTNAGAASAPFTVNVVKSKPAMFTLDQAGDGLAIVQNYVSASETDEDLYVTGVLNQQTVSPAYPGQTLIAWITGLGPISSGDNTAAPVQDVTSASNVKVIVGGVTITPVFAGRAPGLAGEDQVDFVLPADIPTGCAVPLQISANGVTSAATYIAIAPNATAGACVQAGLTTSQLQAIQGGLFSGGSASSFTTGSFELLNITSTESLPSIGTVTATIGTASGEFLKYTGFQLAGYANYANYFTPNNACQVVPLSTTFTTSTTAPPTPSSPFSSGSASLLDAGAITLTGPGGSGINGLPFTETSNIYSLSISEQIPGVTLPGLQNNGTIIGGQYTLKGSGGKDVGPFTGTVNLGSLLTITGGLPSAVTRSAGLPLTWTGGNSSDLVLIEGLAISSTSTTTTTGITVTETGAEFVCTTSAGNGGFTVPASVTSQMPALNPNSSTTGLTAISTLSVFSATNPSNGNGIFTAPLTAGGNVTAYFLGFQGTGNAPIWQ
jgi:uncharacterized protein (TIGR03437 family)